ncbi:MAG TPA: SpoIIE family protein phosphatase [Phycisphaerae bacterium]|nr:SpoIIE family protein phosphatase [Phycisphaerae bacterium]HRW54164.1 SpoIIE family protein phosphatase [Phycisphaerae bacterium]
MAHLMIHYPDGRQVRYMLDKPDIVVGRDASCDLALQDAITSRQHARLYRDDRGRLWIADLKSKNGLLVNDRPVEASPLTPGDRIGIGTCHLVLHEEISADTPVPNTLADTQIGATSAWGAAQDLELSQRRLQSLYELNDRLTGRLDRDDLLRELLEVCREQLQLERAGIAVWRGEPHPVEWVEIVGVDRSREEGLSISRSIVDRALHQGERILFNDKSPGEFDPTASIISNNIRSAMCVPMAYLQRVRGVIYGDRVSSTGGFNKEDIDYFAALGRLGAMGLATVQLVEETKQRERVEYQIGLARQIQTRLFPAAPLRLEGLSIDSLNDPGQRISGDYYDYFERDDGKVVIVMADVAGKGIPASLLMANLQAAVRVKLHEDADLVGSVTSLNRLLCQNAGDDRFVTAIFGILDRDTREFRFVNAGHHEPFMIRNRSTSSILSESYDADLPIGIDIDYIYRERSITLDDRPTMMILYTDGVIDAENETGEQFAEPRFAQTIANNVAQPTDEIVTRIRRSIKQFTRNTPQTDDITIMAVELT